ncbi:MAG TPA: response regulator [Lacunisphaera sp.]|nr:response regulator [Lacunisphaera sp.]
MTDSPLPGPDSTRRLRILFLEDVGGDFELVWDALAAGGVACELTRAATKAEYLSAVKAGGYDLILSDYTLPDYDGLAALRFARELRPGVPFIFVSGTIGEERAIEILTQGATDYVLKHRLARLAPAIRRAMEEVRTRERREQTENALREGEARFREMADNIQEIFWSRSADGQRFIFVSPASAKIWNQSADDLLARPGTWFNAIFPEDRPQVMAALDRLTRGHSFSLQYRVLKPDGEFRWVEDRGYPVWDELGAVKRLVGVAVDISDRKRLELELQQAQKMEAIGQLAGGVAHDFSNVLTVINGYSTLLLDNPNLPPEMAESLRYIYVAGGRAATLIRQLMMFSRKTPAQRRPVDLNEIIGQLAPMLQRLIGEHISLQLDLAQQLPLALADTGMVEQVVMNLAVNARDAMPKGGSLVISTGSCEVTEVDHQRAPGARPGSFAWLSVRDTGVGIPPEVLPRIFEPFFTTKSAGAGTGLGLSTVMGIARQHEGWVEVESEANFGTLFRILLPIAARDESTAVPEAKSDLYIRGGKETILVVEDEVSVREYARTVLQMNGYKILQAGSGHEALEAWKLYHGKIALLLTDLVLPDEMSGSDLAEKLREHRPELKVLYTSGYSPSLAGQMLPSDRGFNFLQKPYQPKTLARLVREILDGGPATAIRTSPSQAPFAP